MGREIRRVPPNWEHPRDKDGNYIPMLDQTYEDAGKEWIASCIEWAMGQNKYQKIGKGRPASDRRSLLLLGMPPNEEYYRPAFDAEPTHYQYYENTSEGTPLSPVFATEAELEIWIRKEGK